MASSSWSDGGSPWKKRSCGSSGDSRSQHPLNWLELPREVTASIFSRLAATEILEAVQFVCTSWFEVCKDPLVWRRIKIGEGSFDLDKVGLDRMCRHAIDRSCGSLVDLNIENFGNDDLLKYITQRCDQIKCLGLVSCSYVSDKGLIEAIGKLPLLEELDLSLCSFSTEPLEAVGRNCLRLRSLKLDSQFFPFLPIFPSLTEEESEINKVAFAIAKNMPNLRHLQLLGNPMNNMGLQAILDGCPKLEFLDLGACRRIDLKGELEKRCTEQIKYLRLPHESPEDFGFRFGDIGPDVFLDYDIFNVDVVAEFPDFLFDSDLIRYFGV